VTLGQHRDHVEFAEAEFLQELAGRVMGDDCLFYQGNLIVLNR
jgi:hypothetical protein